MMVQFRFSKQNVQTLIRDSTSIGALRYHPLTLLSTAPAVRHHESPNGTSEAIRQEGAAAIMVAITQVR